MQAPGAWFRSARARAWLAVVLSLWLVGAAAVMVGAVVDVRTRASGPEAPLRTYLAAVSAEDPEAALLEVWPAARPSAVPFVIEQLGNEYRVLGVGVRQPSLLDRLLGRAPAEQDALITVQLEITLITGEQWRTTTHVPMVHDETGWYLARPPLQPSGS